MKMKRIIILMFCVFILGGCSSKDEIATREKRHQKIQEEMIEYMESKYDESFKGDSIDYQTTSNGGYSDYGVVIPDRFTNTYVEITRDEQDGVVTFSDDYQCYLLGNDFFEYVNNDIKKTYPTSFSYTDFRVLGDTSRNLSFEECKNEANLDLFIALYVTEDEYPIEEVKKAAEEYAIKYHKEFNNSSVLITVFWTIDGEVQRLNEFVENINSDEFYVKDKKINRERSKNLSEKIQSFDITITKKSEIIYGSTSQEERQ